MNATLAALDVTCPRCSGFPNAFARHGNVNGGRCLLCDGALVVSRARAGAFLASQIAPAGRDRHPETGARARCLGEKRIELNGAPATIRAFAGDTEGAKTFVVVTIHPEAGELGSTFTIHGGIVRIRETCNGHIAEFGGREGLRAVLQTAYRGR